MIDTHCHILPGIDDGARTMDEAVEMARVAWRDGITTIVATPHWNAATHPLEPELIAARAQQLQARLDAEGIGLKILPGAEIALTHELVELAEAGRLPTMAGSQFILVEVSPYGTWEAARQILFELQLRGVGVILAHPERAAAILEDYDRAAELRAGGVRLQVVAADLARRWSNTVGRVAHRLLRDGLATVLATDAHDPRRIPPRLSHLRRSIERLGGPGAFDELTVAGPTKLLDLDIMR